MATRKRKAAPMPAVAVVVSYESAIVGDPVPARLHEWGSKHVRPSCGAGVARGFLCLNCVTYLANETQRDMHCEAGRHIVARVCGGHGAEVLT